MATHVEATPANLDELWRPFTQHALRQPPDFGIELDAFQIEHEALGIFHRQQLMRHRRRRLEDEPRVFLRRPQARGRNHRSVGATDDQPMRRGQQQPPAHTSPLERDATQAVAAEYASRHALPG